MHRYQAVHLECDFFVFLRPKSLRAMSTNLKLRGASKWADHRKVASPSSAKNRRG